MTPDLSEPYWGVDEVAAYLGVGASTVTGYRKRGEMPAHDRKYGRSYVWKPATIIEWHENRPRVGVENPDKAPLWRLVDMRLSSLDCELKRAAPMTPLSFGTPDIKPSVSFLGDRYLLTPVDYAFTISDSSNHTIATFKIRLVALWSDLPEDEPPLDLVNLFIRQRVLPFFHNHLREQLHDLTMRMGLPPLLIELFRWTGDELPTNPSPTRR